MTKGRSSIFSNKNIPHTTLMMCPQCHEVSRQDTYGMHICSVCGFEWNYSTSRRNGKPFYKR